MGPKMLLNSIRGQTKDIDQSVFPNSSVECTHYRMFDKVVLEKVMNKIEHVDEIYKSNHFDIPTYKSFSKIKKFKCRPNTMIPDDYADDANFGLRVNDVNEAWFHAKEIFYELLDEFDKTHNIQECKLQQGLKDLHNIFCCIECYTAKESQVDVLAACEVFLYLGKADQLLCAIGMSLDTFLQRTDAINFDFARLMIKLGDMLLYQGNNLEMAYKFYAIVLPFPLVSPPDND